MERICRLLGNSAQQLEQPALSVGNFCGLSTRLRLHPLKYRFWYGFLLVPLALGACTDTGADFPDEPRPRYAKSEVKAATTDNAPEVSGGELILSGEITADANRTARVSPLVGGQVVRVGVELGDEVRRGQVLAVVKSSEIAVLQNQHLAGTVDLAVAHKNLAVAEEFYQVGLGAEQDVYKARKEMMRASGTNARNQRQLEVYSPGQNGLYELRAPVAGFITERRMATGMRFTTSNLQTAFTVVNLDSVWVLAHVFEADLNQVRQGQAVEITTLSYPGQPLRGRIDKVFNLLDHDSKVMKVHCTLPNPGYRLKPGMHAQVRLLPTPAQIK